MNYECRIMNEGGGAVAEVKKYPRNRLDPIFRRTQHDQVEQAVESASSLSAGLRAAHRAHGHRDAGAHHE
jgi:hypothetical protein